MSNRGAPPAIANLEAVDARIDRARRQLCRIKAGVADFRAERARQIVREECGDLDRRVYRGGSPEIPIQ